MRVVIALGGNAPPGPADDRAAPAGLRQSGRSGARRSGEGT